MKETKSIIGETLTPDFSKEEDMGGALYGHMQNLSPLLRSALTVSDPEADGHLGDIHDLLELFSDGFMNGLREFDAQRTERAHAGIAVAKGA